MFDAFIADLHLQAEAPDELAQALSFLDWAKGRCGRLYILGDLFEFWLGDDNPLPGLESLQESLGDLSRAGCAITVMHGNRDFLIGEQFCADIGATLAREDERIVMLGDRKALVLHGDTLCTDDLEYQKARLSLRNPQWQQQFLALPPPTRLAQAQAMRQQSKDSSQQKTETIMDVNACTVAARAADHQVDLLIHGHTHRPHWHSEPGLDRVVVGDWHRHGAEVALYDGQKLALKHWPF